jgi:hypothetical protein
LEHHLSQYDPQRRAFIFILDLTIQLPSNLIHTIEEILHFYDALDDGDLFAYYMIARDLISLLPLE